MLLHPVISVPRDAQGIVDLLALLIATDIRTGGAVASPPAGALVYVQERRDWWAAPEETAARGAGDCEDIVRLEGGTRGDAVGAVRNLTDNGWHVFLLEGGRVVDVCAERGMPAAPAGFYDDRERWEAPIRRPAAEPASEPPPGPSSAAPADLGELVRMVVGADDPEGAARALAGHPELGRAAGLLALLLAAMRGEPIAQRAIRATTGDDRAALAAMVSLLEGPPPLPEPEPQPGWAVAADPDELAAWTLNPGCPGTCAVRR